MDRVGARDSPISLQLPDRPQRTLRIAEAEMKRENKRETGRGRDKGRRSQPGAHRDAANITHTGPAPGFLCKPISQREH